MGTAITAAQQPVPWLPSDNNLLVANMDPATPQVTFTLAAATIYLAKLSTRLPTSQVINNLWIQTQLAGAGASTGSFIGGYSSAGNLLATSADLATQFTASPNAQQCPLLSSLVVPVAPSFIWTAIQCNLATTQVTLIKAVGLGVPGAAEMGLTVATARWAQIAGAAAPLPASITPGSLAFSLNTYMVGGS